jgi:hypothetical protein
MNNNIANIVLVGCFVAITSGFMLINIIKPDSELSYFERRKLLPPPEYSTDKLLSGEFFNEYEEYFLDQFVSRDMFRGLKAFTRLYLLNQKDNNGIYIVDGNINRIEYPLNEKAILNAAEKLNQVYERYLQGLNVSYAVIPDKNYFLAEKFGYLAMDYDRLLEILQNNVQNMQYIDLFPYLTIDDYYRTDIHWSQDKIIDIADILLSGMGNGYQASDLEYTKQELHSFYGSLYGQAALSISPDTLFYMTNAMLENAIVFDYGTLTESKVYMTDLFNGIDPYDVFLSGAKALMTIDNPAAESDRELILFRDSFGSSIAPLLLSGYSKITLVDLRYITTDLLGNYIDFSGGQDVLFLYSTQILNNSFMLK